MDILFIPGRGPILLVDEHEARLGPARGHGQHENQRGPPDLFDHVHESLAFSEVDSASPSERISAGALG